jgi:hypothetical protein
MIIPGLNAFHADLFSRTSEGWQAHCCCEEDFHPRKCERAGLRQHTCRLGTEDLGSKLRRVIYQRRIVEHPLGQFLEPCSCSLRLSIHFVRQNSLSFLEGDYNGHASK